MSITIGPVIDYLVTLAQTATAGVLVDGDPIQVVDGWPDHLSPGMVIIGLSSPPPDVNVGDVISTREWSPLGNRNIDEDFTVPCLIDVRLPGNVQKAPRDVAESVFNNLWALITADVSLGKRLYGNAYIAEINDLIETPSNIGTAAEPGRRQLIAFAVHCRNLIT